MISDVLSDAVNEIERYRADCPDYADHAAALDAVTYVMDAVRQLFDAPELTEADRERVRALTAATIAVRDRERGGPNGSTGFPRCEGTA